MDLGYCVVFDHMEQGWEGLTVVVTSDDLESAVTLVETISGYPRDHQRYTQEVFDLTRLYHQQALGEVGELDLMKLSQYSPESINAINKVSPVDYSVQAYTPLGARCWINRKWGFVTDALYTNLRENSVRSLERTQRS